ncbi:anti-repressor SinI family protein [uncultured Metabacillus sp.]|uniref:anti-repressor SinI family protein n=1 Tax=Metabacillus sp. Hm71 TaxID=3450743 RepID=UPI002636A12A|nr:anti-repressor SinI family protein [uncultured Metabacillus sp.]
MNIEIIDQITKDGHLDREWVELILEALEVGISVEEIKAFLAKKGNPALSQVR